FGMTRDDLDRLAAAPVGATLNHLRAGIHLTPDTFAALKKFPKLTALFCSGRYADDELLLQLKELPNLTHLGLFSLGQDGKFGDRGVAAITALPLQTLSFSITQPIDAGLARRIAAMPDLTVLILSTADMGDDVLAILAGCRKLRYLNLRG